MILSDMIQAVRNASGQASSEVIKSALQAAATEIWNTVDLPGVLRELRVCTNSERYVALPWQVYKIRKARNANSRQDLELNTTLPQYSERTFYQGEFTVRDLRTVPLHTKITNASTLKFTLRRAESFDVVITVTGETDMSSRCVEPVTIPAGSLYQETVERYVNIPDSITKNKQTYADIDVTDASGNAMAEFPAHLYELTYRLVQFYDRCVTLNNPYLGCVDLVYKPHMPPLEDDNDGFPEPWHQVVIFKALEQIYLKSDETIKTAKEYNQKAAALLAQFSTDEMVGKTLRPAMKANKFVTTYPGKL